MNIRLTYTLQINQLLGSFSSCLTTNAANLSWWYLSAGTHSQKYIMFEGCCYPNPKNPTWTVLSPYPFNPLAVWTKSTEVQLGNWCTIGDIVPGTLKAGQGWARYHPFVQNTEKTRENDSSGRTCMVLDPGQEADKVAPWCNQKAWVRPHRHPAARGCNGSIRII